MPGLGDAFVGGLLPEDWMLGGEAPPQNPPDQPWPSWLQKAQDLNNRDVAAYQGGGIAGLLANISDPAQQELASGFGGGGIAGRTKAVGGVAKAAAEAAAPAAQDVSLAAPYVSNPVRVFAPGVYKDPRTIVSEAAARVAPEHPALKDLFGVTRDDLYGMSQQGTRQGNIEPTIPTVGKPGQSAAAQAIMNPANAQRMVDVLAEAQKRAPQLTNPMDAWYVMDPMYQRMAKLVGPEQAKIDYMRLNSIVTPFSSGSPVQTEINRGTAAHQMATQGNFADFLKYGNTKASARGADFPPELSDVKGHVYHLNQARPVERYLQTGEHGYSQDTVKVPLYMQASGVPETGFQTRLPVPDAHFTRATGMPDVRTNAEPGAYMGRTEYREVGPWFRENVAKPLGVEAVPAQGRMWGVYGPQTDVKTLLGAPKLELFAQNIWERAQKLGLDPQKLRDDVLQGKAHALWLMGIPAAGIGAQLGAAAIQDQQYQ